MTAPTKATDLSDVVKEQHEKVQITAISSEKSGYKRTTHPEAQWYAQAGFGLFFHWGLSSVEGKGDPSWAMMERESGFPQRQARDHGIYAVQTKMTPNSYWEQAERFLCENYDPDKWLAAAKEAGVQYVVLTTKHHDGFCLWPSEFGEMNTKKYLGGRDLVGEFVAACRKNELKIGFYYSPPDWYYHRNNMSFRYGHEKPSLDRNHEPFELPVLTAQEQEQFAAGYRELVNGHVTELLSRYGKIDLLWYDGRMPAGAMTLDVPLTHKGATTYAHIDWLFDDDAVEIKNLPDPQTVRLLRTGDEIAFDYIGGVLKFQIPQRLRTNLTDVVAIA